MYTVTDVEDLHNWMVKHLTEHPLFRRMTDKELVCCAKFQLVLTKSFFKEGDPCVNLIMNSSEESKKVDRESRNKYPAIFQRIASTTS